MKLNLEKLSLRHLSVRMLAKMARLEKAVDSPVVLPVDQDSAQTWLQSLRSPHSSNLAPEDHSTKIDLLHLGPTVSEKQDRQLMILASYYLLHGSSH